MKPNKLIESINEAYELTKWLGSDHEAIDKCDAVLKIYPKNISALKVRAFALRKIHRHREAIDDLNKVLEIDPTNVGALKGKVFTLCKVHQYQDAVDVLNNALEINSTRIGGNLNGVMEFILSKLSKQETDEPDNYDDDPNGYNYLQN